MRATPTVSIPLPGLIGNAFLPYSALVVLVAMLFGGGARQSLWSDVVVQLVSLPLFAWALFRITSTPLDRLAGWGIALLGGILALPLLQLIPLPPALWTALPERHTFAAAFESADIVVPWFPISLDPAATWRSFVALIPAAAVFLAMLSLNGRERRILIALGFAVALVSVPLAFLQVMDGTDSRLRFYAITNFDRAVGFFANANHNAAFLYCAIPVAAGWAIGLFRVKSPYRAIGSALLLIIIIAALIGLAFTRSRAGIALGIMAGLFCIALIVWQGDRTIDRRLLFVGIGVNLVALLIVFQFGFLALAERAEKSELIEDLRWPVAETTTQAALANNPVGSGFGTFSAVYEMYAPRAMARQNYVNHAHNDWLELWLAGGAPALLLIFVFLVWFGFASFSAWRTKATDLILENSLARAASIVVLLLLIHSVVDYPLRTAGVSVLFAEVCALLIPSRTRTHKGLQREESRNTAIVV